MRTLPLGPAQQRQCALSPGPGRIVLGLGMRSAHFQIGSWSTCVNFPAKIGHGASDHAKAAAYMRMKARNLKGGRHQGSPARSYNAGRAGLVDGAGYLARIWGLEFLFLWRFGETFLNIR